jgi:hypothetical protein
MSFQKSFDLNIENYATKELEEMMNLPPTYDLPHIEKNAKSLIDSLILDTTIDGTKKKKTIQFVENVKQRLAENVKKLMDSNLYHLDSSLRKVEVTESSGSSFLIQKPPTAYAQSFPSEYYQGIINPLNQRILTKNLCINTKFRDNYNQSLSTNYHFDLPIKFSNIVSMQLTSFEIPNTVYVISKSLGNQYFWVSAKCLGSGGVEEHARIEVDTGNYTPPGLIFAFNEYVTNHFDQFTYLKNLKFAYDADVTNKTKVFLEGVVCSEEVELSLLFQENYSGVSDMYTPLPLKLGWILGFRGGLYVGDYSYESEGVVDTNPCPYFFLVVNDYNNNVNNGFYSAFQSSLLNNNILARISLGTPQNVITSSQNNLNLVTTPRKYFGPVDIQKLHIQLLDEYGRVLDLNHMDYSFCLSFQTVYDL